MATNIRTDIEAALVDPASVFDTPHAVLADQTLDDALKLRILTGWEAQAVHLQVSEGEGFAGGEPSRLDEVKQAIARLRAG